MNAHLNSMCAPFLYTGFSAYSYSTMEFNDVLSALHMSLLGAGYGSGDGRLGSEISGAVLDILTPGASRLQASHSERPATTQQLHGSRGLEDSASGISTDILRSSGFSGAINRTESPCPPPDVTFVASPHRTEDRPSECPYRGHRHWPGVHSTDNCCMNAPFNLKPGRESPSSSDSGSTHRSAPDLEDSSSEAEPSYTGNNEIIEEILENQVQEVWNHEFLNRPNWSTAEANYRSCLRDWFRASCQFIRESGRVRFDTTLQEEED